MNTNQLTFVSSYEPANIETTPVIRGIHESIDSALKHLWFNNLSDFELTDIDSALPALVNQLVTESALGIANGAKNILHDSALSHYLDAKVYYCWGEANRSAFDLARELRGFNISDEADYLTFCLDGVHYIFVYYDECTNLDCQYAACKLVQSNWYVNLTDPEPAFMDESGEYYSKTIDFLVEQLYIHYGYWSKRNRIR